MKEENPLAKYSILKQIWTMNIFECMSAQTLSAREYCVVFSNLHLNVSSVNLGSRDWPLGCQLLSFYNDLLKVCTILNCNHVLGKNYVDILQPVQIRLIYETPLYFAFFFASTKNQRYSVRMDLYHDGCTIVAEMFCAVWYCHVYTLLTTILAELVFAAVL